MLGEGLEAAIPCIEKMHFAVHLILTKFENLCWSKLREELGKEGV